MPEAMDRDSVVFLLRQVLDLKDSTDSTMWNLATCRKNSICFQSIYQFVS
jgi:hypothetical protein